MQGGVIELVIGYKRWRRQKYLLNRIDLPVLVRAYLTYPAIQVYFVLFAVGGLGCLYLVDDWVSVALAAAAAALIYPLVWYLLHRYVLHGAWLYKSPWTAALWKRIHFDHHQNPNDLAVLFGGLHTTLPTILVVTYPIGWLIGGAAGGLAAVAAALATTCFYEFMHCIHHLSYKPKSAFARRIKRLHLAHHFHNETGNFGITNFLWDRLLGTFYAKPTALPLSPTTRNLGYTEQVSERYPWVARLTETKALEPAPRFENATF